LVFSLFVLAQETTTTPTTTPESTTTPSTTTTPPTTTPTATTTPSKRKEVDLTCMKNAVEKREDALKTDRETHFNKISQAYDERKTALLNA
jgi:hypothetical protein